MAILKKITGNTTDTIIARKHVDKKVIAIYIACTHDTVDLIVDRLYLDDGSNEYDIIANVKIPVGAALDTSIPLYNHRIHDLKLTTTNSSNCTIIIR